MDVQPRITRERIPCHALRKRRRNVPLHQGFFAEVGTRSRASRGRLSNNDIRWSASDRRWFPARPAQHVHRRRNNGKGPNTIGTRQRAWQKRQKTRRDMQRRTRRSASTIRGAAPDTIIGRAAADRAGARPYRATRCENASKMCHAGSRRRPILNATTSPLYARRYTRASSPRCSLYARIAAPSKSNLSNFILDRSDISIFARPAEPITSHQPPATSHQPPATSHQPPATSHQPPTTIHQTRHPTLRPPSTIHPPPATCHPPPATSPQPPATSHQPPATSHQPPATSHQPPATSHQPPATSHQPPATSHQP